MLIQFFSIKIFERNKKYYNIYDVVISSSTINQLYCYVDQNHEILPFMQAHFSYIVLVDEIVFNIRVKVHKKAYKKSVQYPSYVVMN